MYVDKPLASLQSQPCIIFLSCRFIYVFKTFGGCGGGGGGGFA